MAEGYRTLIAGDGGSVLVAASTSADAVALACEGLGRSVLTPSGIPVVDTASIADLSEFDRVRLLPCEPSTRASVMALGVPIVDEPVERVACALPVITVSAASTGVGKTALVRRITRTLAKSGVRTCVVRHPIASLLHFGRFDPIVLRTPPELAGPRPLEEREEVAPLVGAGVPVVSGLDVARAFAIAAREADVIVWDGGGAAVPYVDAAMSFFVVDPLRPQTLDLARAASSDVVVITKVDSAPADRVRAMETGARTVLADLAVAVQPVGVLADKAAVVVEDAGSLLLGGLSGGAGAVAARRFRCGVVDPRPFAVGAIASALRDHPHVQGVIPSLGRTQSEQDDLAATIAATPGDVVLWASNADPSTVISDETRPIVRAYGELTEVAGPSLQELLAPFLPGH